MKRRIFDAGIIYLLGNIFDKGLAFITVPIFTKLLSPNDYGILTTYLSWTSILSIILTLSLSESVRVAFTDFEKEKDAYLSSILSLSTLSAIVMTILIIAVAFLFDYNTSIKLIFLCCLHAYSAGVIPIILWYFVMEFKYWKRVLLQSVPNILIVLSSVLYIMNLEQEKYLGRILPNVIILGLLSLFLLIKFLKKGKVFYHKDYWSYAIKFSLPTMFHMVSSVVLSQLDRSMILGLRNASEAGLYGLAYQFGLLPMVVMTTAENLWIPWFTRMLKADEKILINKVSSLYINLIMFVCILGMLLAKDAIGIISTSAYHGAAAMISPILGATFFMGISIFAINLEYFYKKTKYSALYTTIVGLINIILNYLLVPKYGAIAAAYTTLISYIILFIMHIIKSRQIDQLLFPIKSFSLPSFIVLVMSCVVPLIQDMRLYSWIITFVLVILSSIVFYKQYKHIQGG